MGVNWRDFVRESNRIEGIKREPTEDEIRRLSAFVALPKLEVEDVVDFVKFTQPDAVLRDSGLIPGVRVGDHVAPPSGPKIRGSLADILGRMQFGTLSTFEAHCEYLNLHPFTDGNGRSARAIWLWNMNGQAPLGFLHHFYYQTLSSQDSRKVKNSS